MIEIIWRVDTQSGVTEEQPQTAAAARARLETGSARFAALSTEKGRQIVMLPPDALGLPQAPGDKIAQEPFAAVLGCADARVPSELVFGQTANDLFTVRVAGNVPGTECLGSLDYAVTHLPSVRLLVVLGHTGCGAVAAAVDAYLEPDSYFALAANSDLRAIVDSIMAAVTMSAAALTATHGAAARQEPGFRAALIETSVVVNAALTASLIQRQMVHGDRADLGVVFGVYDLARRSAGLPASDGWQAGLVDPPEDAAALRALAERAAAAFVP